jgi:hypothetical protein
MEKTVITWNVENWITVFLMVLLGMYFLKLAGVMLSKWKGGSNGKAAD